MNVRAICHCGDIVLTLSVRPTEVFECNCSICRKLGVLWAYYHCDDVFIESGDEGTDTYIWNNKVLAFHSCPNCGCTTHWKAVDPEFREKMGVNARLINGLTRDDVTLDFVDHGDLAFTPARLQQTVVI